MGGMGGHSARKPSPEVQQQTVTLEQLYNGNASIPVEVKRLQKICKTCDGRGGKAGSAKKCNTCQGSGTKVSETYKVRFAFNSQILF